MSDKPKLYPWQQDALDYLLKTPDTTIEYGSLMTNIRPTESPKADGLKRFFTPKKAGESKFKECQELSSNHYLASLDFPIGVGKGVTIPVRGSDLSVAVKGFHSDAETKRLKDLATRVQGIIGTGRSPFALNTPQAYSGLCYTAEQINYIKSPFQFADFYSTLGRGFASDIKNDERLNTTFLNFKAALTKQREMGGKTFYIDSLNLFADKKVLVVDFEAYPYLKGQQRKTKIARAFNQPKMPALKLMVRVIQSIWS